jgi:hypothetical protein
MCRIPTYNLLRCVSRLVPLWLHIPYEEGRHEQERWSNQQEFGYRGGGSKSSHIDFVSQSSFNV